MKKVNQNYYFWIVVVLLIIAVSYIAFDKYSSAKEQEQISIFQRGAQLGYQQAVLQMMKQVSSCQPVPLFADNVSVNIVSLECLQQQAQPTASE